MEVTAAIATLVAMSIVVEYCVERVKAILGERVMEVVKAPWWAAAFGVLFACLFRLDLFAAVGFSSALPVVPYIVTGLLLSGGSGAMHELIAKLRESRTPTETL